MVLDLSAFEKAIESYRAILIRYDKEAGDDAIRDAVIQRFEYTYEFCIKIIKRFLKELGEDNVNGMTFNEIIRRASKAEILLNDISQWVLYREKRNMTSRTYDEKRAMDVISSTKEFEKDAKYLLEQLKCRL